MATNEPIKAEAVKRLRDLTGAGFMDCKRALEEAGGDVARAVAILRERGQAAAARRAEREAREGLVASYIHPGGRLGVLIEVNCETDFVARTEEFQRLARDLAMQVAGLGALYPTVESVPAEVVEAKRAELQADPIVQQKPETVQQQIVDGQLKKWYAEVALYEQPFRDTEMTVRQLVEQKVAQIGENIRVRRFVRFALGGES